MAQLERKWIADGAVNNAKIDHDATYEIGGLYSKGNIGVIDAASPQDNIHIKTPASEGAAGITLELDGTSGRAYRIYTDDEASLHIRDTDSSVTRLTVREGVNPSASRLGIDSTIPRDVADFHSAYEAVAVRLDTDVFSGRTYRIESATSGKLDIIDVDSDSTYLSIDPSTLSTVIANDLQIGRDATIGTDLQVNGDFRVTGNSVVTNDLQVTRDATVGVDLQVNGDSRVSGNSNVGIDLQVTRDATVGVDLQVNGDSRVSGNSNVGIDLQVTRDATVGVDLQVNGDSRVSGNSNVGIDLQVTRDATVGVDLQVNGDSRVSGNSNVGIDLQVTRDATVGVDLQVNGDGTFQDLRATRNLNVGFDILANRDLGVIQDLRVSRDATVNGVLRVYGDATVQDIYALRNAFVWGNLQTIGDGTFQAAHVSRKISFATGGSISYVDSNSSLGTSDTAVPTQHAVKDYVDSQVGGASYWNRTGTVLSPATAGDSISTTVTGDGTGVRVSSQWGVGVYASTTYAANVFVGDSNGGNVFVGRELSGAVKFRVDSGGGIYGTDIDTDTAHISSVDIGSGSINMSGDVSSSAGIFSAAQMTTMTNGNGFLGTTYGGYTNVAAVVGQTLTADARCFRGLYGTNNVFEVDYAGNVTMSGDVSSSAGVFHAAQMTTMTNGNGFLGTTYGGYTNVAAVVGQTLTADARCFRGLYGTNNVFEVDYAGNVTMSGDVSGSSSGVFHAAQMTTMTNGNGFFGTTYGGYTNVAAVVGQTLTADARCFRGLNNLGHNVFEVDAAGDVFCGDVSCNGPTSLIETNRIQARCNTPDIIYGSNTSSSYTSSVFNGVSQLGLIYDGETNGGMGIRINQAGAASGLLNAIAVLNLSNTTFRVTFEGEIYSDKGSYVCSGADFAEWCCVDGNYYDIDIGTVVAQSEEKDMAVVKATDNIYGVSTDRASFCGGLPEAEKGDMANLTKEELEIKYNARRIALVGHVLCKVTGKIKRNDKLVISNIPGVARAAQTSLEKMMTGMTARQAYDGDGVGLIEILMR
jgi:hypothetical protein